MNVQSITVTLSAFYVDTFLPYKIYNTYILCYAFCNNNERKKILFLKCNSAFFLSRISLQYLSEQIKYIEVLNA